MGSIKGRAKCIPKDRDAVFLPFQSAWIKDDARIKLMWRSRARLALAGLPLTAPMSAQQPMARALMSG